MSARKKLNQGIGFGASNNNKDDEQPNSINTALDTIPDTTLDTTKHNALSSKLNSHLNSVQSSALVDELDSNIVSKLGTSVDSIRYTGKSTFQIPSKTEPFSKRLVANVTPSQKLFVQEMSKKFENESSFVRFMIQRFMEDIEITEGE